MLFSSLTLYICVQLEWTERWQTVKEQEGQSKQMGRYRGGKTENKIMT